MHYIVLYYTALHSTALYCTSFIIVLHCTALHCTALHCTACKAPPSTVVHSSILHCVQCKCGTWWVRIVRKDGVGGGDGRLSHTWLLATRRGGKTGLTQSLDR